MPTFVHPALLWGLVGAAIPVLIHLINMLRHRRIEWAAMEFLLASQRKHRTWIVFKQLLLLLMRMAAVAAIVLMAAQPRLRGQLGNLLGGTRVHHIVLLDDSFSMSDHWANTNAFSEAKQVVDRLGGNAVRQDRLQSFTMLRFSRAGRASRSAEPDLLKQPVNSGFGDKLTALLAKLKVTQSNAGPLAALQAVGRLLGDNDGEQRILYLISDFRARQWNEADELRKALLQLGQTGTEIHLVACVDRARPNLAIVSLAPAEGILAAGVPWSMEVAVQNFGAAPARRVAVTLGEDGHGRPAVALAEIAPGKTAKERFEVRLPNAGPHQITARLEGDAVEADNHRFAAIDLPADVPVLLIDGDAKARTARYLSLALSPGDPIKTGIRPRIETPRYLSLKPLGDFQAVNLANVDRLDSAAVAALEKYAASGGGVAFFLGEKSDVKFFNDVLYRGGKGLFPLPLLGERELPVDRLEPAPDLQIDGHFIFRVFAAEQNAFLQAVKVDRFFAVPDGWRPPRDSSVRVAAHLRNGAPLVVERSFGKGRVMAFLTTAAPTWNNWARVSPSFVVVMLELQAYLSERPGAGESRLVGSPLALQLDPALYRPQVAFTPPEDSTAPATAVTAVRGADGTLTASFADTDLAGFYGVKLARADNSIESRQYAVNVDPAEGDLRTAGAEQIAAGLAGVKYQFEQAASFQSAPGEIAGSNLGEVILCALVLLLIGEQALAWSASYHPARRRASVRGGAA